MKKLTAGILASLIGLVSANSADAAVASKAYVDGAVESLDVAKIENANAEASYIKNIAEVDGKVTAETGALNEIALKGIAEGDAINFEEGDNGATVVNADVRTTEDEENIVKVELKTDSETNKTYYEVTAEKQKDNNTKYTFKDGEGVDFIEAYDEASDTYTYQADAKIKAADGSTNVTIGSQTVNGQNYVTIDVAEGMTYTFDDDIVADKDGAYHTSYFEAVSKDVITAEQETTEGDGWYVLMRKQTGTEEDGTPVYTYHWENLDRSYDANDPSVGHDDEAGNTPTTGA